jgi:hypothetical protein
MKTPGLLKNRRMLIFIVIGIFLFLTPLAYLQAYMFPGDCKDLYERDKLSEFANGCAEVDSDAWECTQAYEAYEKCLKYDKEKKIKEDLLKYGPPAYSKGGPLPPGVNIDELVENVKQEMKELFEEANKLWKEGKQKEGDEKGRELSDKREWLKYLKELQQQQEIKGGETGTGAATPGGMGGGAPGEIAVVPTAQQVISGTQPTKTEEYDEGVAGFNILLQPQVNSLDYGGNI